MDSYNEMEQPGKRRGRSNLGSGVQPISGGGGIFKSAAVEVLRQERRLMTTGEITKCACYHASWGTSFGPFWLSSRALDCPLTDNSYCRIALQRGFLKAQGKTPEATMASALYTDVKKRNGTSIFTRYGHCNLAPLSLSAHSSQQAEPATKILPCWIAGHKRASLAYVSGLKRASSLKASLQGVGRS